MGSTPPYRKSDPIIASKSASRLAKPSNFEEQSPNLNLSLDLVSYSSPKKENQNSNTISPKPRTPLSLHDLLLLSPSPVRRSRTRGDMAEEHGEINGSRRRCRSKNGIMGLVGCASPRNGRRLRKRLDQEIREDKDLVVVEDLGHKQRKKRSKKEKLSSGHSIASPKGKEGDGCCYLDVIGQLMKDLIMWNDVAKSSLWFGFGSLCFLSSCFTRGINYSIFSLISQLGLLFLGFSFLSNSISERNNVKRKCDLKLREEDILRLASLILPAANLVISKAGEIFSGEPSMTLKVAPFLLIGAEYGHLLTLWRLSALVFFVSFTGPKLYSSYAIQINQKVAHLNGWVKDAWGACAHKKVVAVSAFTVFWNLTSLKTRIFAAFISLVIIRYNRQHSAPNEEEEEEVAEEKKKQPEEQRAALVLVESELQK